MKNFKILTLLFFGYQCFSQYDGKKFNQFSIEGAYNISVPYTTTDFKEQSNGSFTSFDGFNFGLRYMFNEDWGIKGAFASNNYHGENNLGTNFSRLDVQAVYNLGKFISLPYSTNDRLGLLVHSGFGLSKSESLVKGTTENIGNYIIGVTPIFSVSNRIALTMDMSYVANFKQQFNYDGNYFSNNKAIYKFGYNLNYSIGLVFYIGQKERHADWY